MSNNQLVDSCLAQLQPDMQAQQQQVAGNVAAMDAYNGGGNHSPNSHISDNSLATATLVSRTQKQQVTTVTKVVREVHHMGPESQPPVDYVPIGLPYAHPPHPHHHHHFANYEHMPGQEPTYGPPPDQAHHYRSNYHDFDPYIYPNRSYPSYGQLQSEYSEQPATPPSPSEQSESPTPHNDYLRKAAPFPSPGYDDLENSHIIPRPEHYRITPSPGGLADRYDQLSNTWNMDDSGEASQIPHGGDCKVVYGYSPYSHSAYDTNGGDPRTYEDNDQRRQEASPSVDDQRGMRWRDPNLTEVISFLANPNNVIKANAAAYLQHLCYMDDPNKQKTRTLGGIPPLVNLLNHESPDVYRNACGALRNLSYGRQNDENKRAIKMAGGIPYLMNLLRKTTDADVKELVTGVLWNLSSCEDLKKSIIDDGLSMVVNHIIIPHSGWDPTSSGETCWSTVFRNTSGVLRNVSSAGEYARKKLRECEGLVDSLLYVVKSAIEKSNIGNKSVENCVCILRNLSYRCQEVEDPNYDKHPIQAPSRVGPQPKGENLGCFGASKKKKEAQVVQQKETIATASSGGPRTEPVKGMELLWQPEVVQSYLSLLQSCSNPETLEAAAGALQNLAACYWQPSIEIRAAVRKEKGLPILVELLRMEVDRVVCAVATALRNLAIDQRNKELIGKYAMRDLVQKLPSGNVQHDQGTSDDTIAAVLATLNEVIKKNAEFSRSLLESGGVERLMNITRQRQKYTPRVLKFGGQVLFTMWQHQELREVYKKHGWKEQDFVTKTVAARNAGPHSPNNANSTLNRPMASQGGTRYEDRTIQRPTGASNFQPEDGGIPMADMSYPDGTHAPPPGGVRIFPPAPVKPGEPLYAQVNRDKKKNRQMDGVGGVEGGGVAAGQGVWGGYEEQQAPPKGLVVGHVAAPPTGGDSWV
ncbi:catenin delta-2 isoform X2 [Nilaparvata lugens]|uniref:catenin delta-2 isoform X2 n=1 Tax=Nilaparvata lugens TaxID=108931 RepID=UPI00193DE557|nr:catenin delta-2 isoform X2 [Nilaparvata lugens]